jgi:hypothetical protein
MSHHQHETIGLVSRGKLRKDELGKETFHKKTKRRGKPAGIKKGD